MGFTFSHPALILPVRYFPRALYSLNGLIVGSMIPDLEYFMRLDNVSNFSHNLLGLFLFDLPAALLILTIYHQLIRDPFIKNLPVFFKARLIDCLNFDWPDYFKKNGLVISCSILFGAATHILWDSFTSGNGYFVIHYPILEKPFTIFHITLSVYKLIKHSSSLVGALLLLYVFFKLPKKRDVSPSIDLFYWILVAVLTAGLTALQLATYYQHISTNQLIKKIVSSGLLSLLSISLYYRINSKTMNTSG